MSRDRSAFLELLRESIGFLERSGSAFDDGYEAEAKRLAVTVRVLVHDTPSSQSLLKQLGVKKSLRYEDSADHIVPTNLAPTAGLVIMQFTAGSGGRYVAPLDDLPPPHVREPVDFDTWWTTDVTKDMDGSLWSRKKYVTTLSNKEGGAHVDPNLNSAYDRLVNHNSLGWMFSDELSQTAGGFQGSAAAASVRQIAHELVKTLHREMPSIEAPEGSSEG